MSYDWRQRGTDEAQHAYRRWASRHAEATEEVFLEFGQFMFRQGAQWAVTTTSAISPAVAAMVAFVDWVHEHELDEALT